MEASKLGRIGIVVGLALVIIITMVISVGWSNREIELRNQFEAQQEDNKNIYDAVWKTISQKAQLPEKYAADFKEVYSTIMKDRYAGDTANNPTFKWIHEQNPQFSVDLYADLGDTIEAKRAEFARVQSRLIDIKREHDDLRKTFPSSLVVGGRPSLELLIVTSTKTEETFATGKEDDVELFK